MQLSKETSLFKKDSIADDINGTYGSNIVAMVYSKFGSSLTREVSCTAIWVKNS